ncbi:TetR family transcriptional regulator [Mycolicibacterium llatzerense]|nr:TetR family transcriptional regulator [Mycolicibacterium llatzerense]MCT7372874.1 TetR family transcriptional regulator [Mycolicibacterium llatzerense]
MVADDTSLSVACPVCQDGGVRSQNKRWGGRTGAERRAERRQRFIEAATEIWTENGWAAVTMRGVCAATGLNDRYFYEEFKTRDDLLVAAWDGVRSEVLGELSTLFNERIDRPAMETIAAAISIVVDRIASDPGQARILLAHHVGSSPLQDRRALALQDATQLVVEASRPHLLDDVDEAALRMDTLVAVGGFVEVITAWHSGLLDVSKDEVIVHTSRLAEILAQRYLAD